MILMGLLLAAVLGLIPAAIASGKGRDFALWWLYGALLFIVALPHALVIGRDQAELDRREISGGESRACPHCAEVIRRQAKVCRFCGRDVEPVLRGAEAY